MLIYLDNSATTRQYDQVTTEMVRVMESDYGNPSSLHRLGLSTEKLVRKARKEIARSIGVGEDEIFITSGGTEADNAAILGIAFSRRRNGNKIITSKIEHPAVLESCKRLERDGYEVVYLDVDKNGVVLIDQLKREIDHETILISIMHVNNEIGTIQPIEEIYRMKEEWNKANDSDILLHVDAIQSYGKLNLCGLHAELISLSGHKVHGPKGIGALYIKKGVRLDPIILGGGQEKGQRSGTENVPAIAGFGVAAARIINDQGKAARRIKSMKENLIYRIRHEIANIKINGNYGDGNLNVTDANESNDCEEGFSKIDLSWTSPSILNVSFLGIRGEVLLHSLEQEGIYVSTGSACSSNKKGQSHVLKEIGLNNMEIEGAIRFSLSEFNTQEDIDFTVDNLVIIVNKMRKLSSFR
ncbi:MAG: cysteine desulfurase [Peptostreptococcaceae bacterium]|nr:cysteine desulfurase [Peptostreptococcaceae bacterium]